MSLPQNLSKLVLVIATTAGSIVSASAGDARPVVVELFTSQGCSSCPPANANLIELSKRPGVLALSFAVTYWDYLGWKDSFGKPEFTERQAIYEPALGERGPFTPQMVIDGKESNVGFRLEEVEKLIASTDTTGGPSLKLEGGTVEIGKGKISGPAADVWLVRYNPETISVPVGRGENRGATLPHTHVVHSLDRLGAWNGDATSFKVASSQDGTRAAILVQSPKGGPILAAVTE